MDARTDITAQHGRWQRMAATPSAKAWCQTVSPLALFQANHGGFSSGLGLELSHNLREESFTSRYPESGRSGGGLSSDSVVDPMHSLFFQLQWVCSKVTDPENQG